MSSYTVILLLGTNLKKREENIKNAKFLITNEIGEIFKESEIIETKPEGFESDNFFLNQTIWINTPFSPIKLLEKIKDIEHKMGRVYLATNQLYQDRIIDIDILFYEKLIFKSKSLTIPHPQVVERKFVKKLINHG